MFASTSLGHALPTVTEPFLTGGANYSVGTANLGGQGPTAAGFSGTWSTNDGVSADIIAGGLSYTDGTNSVASSGGAVEFPGAGNGRVSRNLANAYDGSSSGTVYFAAMIQPDTLGSGYRGMELFGPGGRAIQIVTGEPGIAADGNFVVRINDNNNGGNAGDLGAGSTSVNFFIGKITFSATADQDSISLWRNPANLSNEAASGPANFTKSGINLTLDRVALARFNAADGFKADEIRFGGSWTDVTTVDLIDSDAAIVDGTRDAALYSTPLAVQTVNTEFGNNANEWNAAFAYVNLGKLYLMFTGNLNSESEKLEIFIDSAAGGSSTFTSAGNDGANVMNGMKFDTAFAPEYHLIARRGFGKLDLDFAKLGTMPAFSHYSNVFGVGDSGSGVTGTGTGTTNTSPIRVGYNGSNIAGITGGDTAADQQEAALVTTGLELCIDLADLGNPTGPIKVMLLQNNNNHDFPSNQTLGGLIPTPTFGNLGNPANTKDFSSYGGDQFFSVDPSPVHLFAGNTAIRFAAKGLTTGVNYVVQESTTLASFTDVPNSGFTAAGAVQVITLPVTPGTEPRYFLRTKSVP